MGTRTITSFLLLVVQVHLHHSVDAFGTLLQPIRLRPIGHTHSCKKTIPSKPQLPVCLRRARVNLCELRCGAGGIIDPDEKNENNEQEAPTGGANISGSDASPDLSIPQGRSRNQIRTKKAFQLAWKQKFRGKGADLTIPPKEEAFAKLNRNIETNQKSLQDLRVRCAMLASRLESAVREERYGEAAQCRDQLQQLRLQDPIHLRQHLWSEMMEAGKADNLGKAVSLRLSVQEVERYMPQYKLGGEWEGIYASHGKETINIHYEGSTLVAVKMTGDDNVPKGEITFTVDLSAEGLLGPVGRDAVTHPAEKIRMVLEGYLDNIIAFKGRGQVAKAAFKSPQFIDGQLLVFEEGVIGFIFLPLVGARRKSFLPLAIDA